jgi:hypothetical protein
MKSLISKKKVRMAKIENPLNSLNLQENETGREEEEYFRKYFEEKRKRETRKKINKMTGEIDEEEGKNSY